MTTTNRPDGFRLQGRHVLFGVIGFFAVIFALDGYFVALAMKTFPGQVTESPFEEGLAFNGDIARREAQARLGWTATAQETAAGVVVVLKGRDGHHLSGLNLTGALERPATEAGRQTLRFTEASPGVYTAAAQGLAGAWDLTATAQDGDGARFDLTRRLVWR